MKWLIAATAMLVCAVAASLQAQQAAFFVRSLEDPRQRREARAEILDAPVLPGSVVKTIALVSALENGIITPDSTRMCRRVVKVDGQTFTCSHPDLKRALTPAEALAYSCNDFFLSLAPRLSRESLNATRIAAGLPPIAAGTPMASAIVGLAGPKTTPRALVDVMARLTATGKDAPVPMKPETRAVLLQGLRGAADYGTASAFKDAGVPALAKTGTILMPSGAALGLVVALTPADKPTRAIVVAAPGGAGMDAAEIAAQRALDTLTGFSPSPQRSISKPPPNGGANPVNGANALLRIGRTQPDGSTKIETIAMDAYIAQVLAGEGQPKAADAAQEALAITARTFALANRNRHRKEGFDLCDTTHCQVLRPATATTKRAAEATSGRVLLYQGQPAFVFYSAWCGGRSELASQVWPGAIDYSYEPSLRDEACEDEPGWMSEVRASQIETALRDAGLRGTRLRGLRVLARNASGRVTRVGLEGFTPPELPGNEFRMAVGRVAGWQSLKSTAFDVERTSAGYRFKGVGYGHGVGLCVIGAGKRALQGASTEQILKFYYPGLTVGRVASPLTSTASSPVAPAPATAPPAVAAPKAVPAPAATDVWLALPGSEEGERAALMSLIRRSRDDVSKLTGAPAPEKLKVTVHPTVDSFNRATGQPWWVSGATEGSEIDLLPITVLRQQGQLERTIRHEVTHALLDAALAKRPMWVREGAAAYYSRAQPTPAGRGRIACPTEAELTRPLSAGAQRDAYARAEACFARGIAEGKAWSEIK